MGKKRLFINYISKFVSLFTVYYLFKCLTEEMAVMQ